MRGPLDGLLGGDDGPVPRLPVHARVLDLTTVDARVRAFACWEDPGGARALFRELQARVEGSLLGELSETAHALVEQDAEDTAAGRGRDPGPGALHLAVYREVPDVARAVAPFGFRPVAPDDPALRSTLAALRHEWASLELEDEALPERPVSAFVAPVRAPSEGLLALEGTLRRQGVDDVWGGDPGAPFARLLEAMPEGPVTGPGEGRFDAPGPRGGDLDTLTALERALVARDEEVVRWMPPLVFQALCDAVGVVAHRGLGAHVDWGICEPDEESGLAPPPLFRIVDGDEESFLPIGLELLRWCVMPLSQGETPPSLAAWVGDVFARR